MHPTPTPTPTPISVPIPISSTPLRRGLLLASLAAPLLAGLPAPAWAQAQPAKILVGFPAGGSFDAIARLLAEKLKDELKRPVIVENKPGAGGRLAVDILKSSPADGSVIMLGPDALVGLYPFTFRKLNYDPARDLVPVGTVAEFPFALAAGSEPAVKTLAEYVAWAKANPNKANYGIPAPGGPHHFFGMLLGQTIGVKVEHVPFQGSAPMIVGLIGGQVSSAIDVMTSLTEQHKGGKLRILAVSAPQRTPQLPDVPTFAEQGYPAITGMGFNALYAPAGTPAAAVTSWNAALAKVVTLPEVKDRLATMGFLPVGQSPQELAARGEASAKRWAPIIKASGFVAD
jgi:tripartite-type tricarboxylate transporter receptor subunit TctC